MLIIIFFKYNAKICYQCAVRLKDCDMFRALFILVSRCLFSFWDFIILHFLLSFFRFQIKRLIVNELFMFVS